MVILPYRACFRLSAPLRLDALGLGDARYKLGKPSMRGRGARGFRGVGRLVGLGYAQELIFRSRWTEKPWHPNYGGTAAGSAPRSASPATMMWPT